jgi:hypothetical protein
MEGQRVPAQMRPRLRFFPTRQSAVSILPSRMTFLSSFRRVLRMRGPMLRLSTLSSLLVALDLLSLPLSGLARSAGLPRCWPRSATFSIVGLNLILDKGDEYLDAPPAGWRVKFRDDDHADPQAA